MSNLTNYPCLCGHLDIEHMQIGDMLFCTFKTKPLRAYITERLPQTCPCRDFKGDNLRYLENLIDS